MSYRVSIIPSAEKELRKLDRAAGERILRFLQGGIDRENPRSKGTKLVGDEMWRYRVGDHRILALIDDDQILVLVVKVAHRREVYRG